MSKHMPQSDNMKALEQSLNDHMEICSLKRKARRLKAANSRLKAEVERLRKAGDAMASSIQFNEEIAQDYNGPTIVHQSVKAWNAAKESKTSETKSPSFIEDLGNGVEKHDMLYRVPKPPKEGKPTQ